MKRILTAFIVSVLLTGMCHAQCLINDTEHLDRFYIDTFVGNTQSHDEFETDIRFSGRDSYVADQQAFFAPLHVITFDSALGIACSQKNFVTYLASLEVNGRYQRTVWYLEGEEHYKFGGRGPGNATITQDIVVIDAITGTIIEAKRIKYRAMVDF